MRIALIASLSFVAFCVQSRAQEHLEPAASYFATYGHSHFYREAVRSSLVKNAASAPALVVCLPSFSEEWAVYLDRAGEDWMVTLVRPAEQIWGSEAPKTIEVSKVSRKVSSAQALSIVEIFTSAVNAARYSPDPRLGNDGVAYAFTAFVVGAGPRSGEIWTPEEGTFTYGLTTLADALRGFALEEVSTEILGQKIEELQKEKKAAQPGATDNPGDAQ